MAETLVEKVCTPCHGGVSPLTREEADRYLDLVRDWRLLDAARCEKSHRIKIGHMAKCASTGRIIQVRCVICVISERGDQVAGLLSRLDRRAEWKRFGRPYG